MKKTKYLIAAACAASLSLTSAFADGEGWTVDYAAAKKQATDEKKDILLDFTGSDWCPPCMNLYTNILSKEEFRTLTKDNLVLVELDFPNDKSKISEETQKQNQELQGKYVITGYPTILLCDANGRPYAKTGFQESSPKEYVAHLDELRAKKDVRDKAFSEAAKSEGSAKAKALVAALEAMELEDAAVANFYSEIVEQIKAADPKDESGYVKRVSNNLKFAKFEAAVHGLFMKGDKAGALALTEKTLTDDSFEGETKQKVLMAKLGILANIGKFDEALLLVDEVKAAAPDTELAGNMDNIKTSLEKDKAEASSKEKEKPASE